MKTGFFTGNFLSRFVKRGHHFDKLVERHKKNESWREINTILGQIPSFISP